jgi:hypothetical protein
VALPDEALPRLIGAPGAPVTIRLDARVRQLSASYASQTLTLTKVDELIYKATLPPDAAFPGRLTIDADSSEFVIIDHSSWAAVIDDHARGDGPATVSRLRRSSRRLQATVTCEDTCPGVLTLRSRGFRIARLTFAGPGRMKTTISAKALRYLKRHHLKRVHAVLTTRGQAPKTSTMTLLP